MAWLSAHLPAAAAVAAYEHLDALAHTLPTHHDDGQVDPRSMDAKRADVFTSLLLGATTTPEATITPPAPVNVHVIIDGRAPAPRGHRRGPEGRCLGCLVRSPGSARSPPTPCATCSTWSRTPPAASTARSPSTSPAPAPTVHQVEGPAPTSPPRSSRTCSASGTARVSSPAAHAPHAPASSTTPCATPTDPPAPATWPPCACTTTTSNITPPAGSSPTTATDTSPGPPPPADTSKSAKAPHHRPEPTTPRPRRHPAVLAAPPGLGRGRMAARLSFPLSKVASLVRRGGVRTRRSGLRPRAEGLRHATSRHPHRDPLDGS